MWYSKPSFSIGEQLQLTINIISFLLGSRAPSNFNIQQTQLLLLSSYRLNLCSFQNVRIHYNLKDWKYPNFSNLIQNRIVSPKDSRNVTYFHFWLTLDPLFFCISVNLLSRGCTLPILSIGLLLHRLSILFIHFSLICSFHFKKQNHKQQSAVTRSQTFEQLTSDITYKSKYFK